ncbi:hypothetical protein GCM10025782_23080 [Pedococcus ginsenosidimutans]|uniref:DNA primase/polymerase bifunctional N-terminal domain-containing protein n=1 Tax=Pedococcus ginsenosidimutans TaxID=490570 RepID=A0ABP8Y932_9MICO
MPSHDEGPGVSTPPRPSTDSLRTETDPTGPDSVRPYADSAFDYLHSGWSPLPLPPRKKDAPPSGYTGRDGLWPSGADIQSWIEARPHDANICLRTPENVIGLDVDNYDGKPGGLNFAKKIEEWGELPDTYISSSRYPADPVSGIRFFRVPKGLAWPNVVAEGIEVIRYGHRYAVAWPSVHPNGGTYRWRLSTGEEVRIPKVEDLPELPAAWVEGLTGGRLEEERVVAEPPADAALWLTPGNSCAMVTNRLGKAMSALQAGASRHDAAKDTVLALLFFGQQGHHGVATALEALRVAFGMTVGADRPAEWEAEWQRMVAGAFGIVAGEPRARIDCQGPKCTGQFAPAFETRLLPSPTTPTETNAMDQTSNQVRRVVVRKANEFVMEETKWLWHNRLSTGSLSVLAGRQGLGKSTIAAWIAARITRGELPGELFGEPRAVLICATEDSWGHTIVPRLAAAGADLNLVFSVEAQVGDSTMPLNLTVDVASLKEAVTETGAAMVILDPLMSRLGANTDSHKDADVRRDLEPLAKMADATGAVVLGLMHFNKTRDGDLFNAIMGSTAFTAVPRSVHVVIPHPDDDDLGLFGMLKNNLTGRSSTKVYALSDESITRDGVTVRTSKVDWTDELQTPVGELHRASAEESSGVARQKEQCAEFITQFLRAQGGSAPRKDVEAAAERAGYSSTTLKRAKGYAGVVSKAIGTGLDRRAEWHLPRFGDSDV